jgi:hypothetical protein
MMGQHSGFHLSEFLRSHRPVIASQVAGLEVNPLGTNKGFSAIAFALAGSAV